ncbi:MAG: hypothetical protein LBL91_02570 [Lachnospiraceae bacterium]|nr:hypothetical protein [Lachnospiraceae bacterium]
MKFVVDKSLLSCNKVGFHPNDNTATVLFDPNNISKILDTYNVNYEFIEL